MEFDYAIASKIFMAKAFMMFDNGVPCYNNAGEEKEKQERKYESLKRFMLSICNHLMHMRCLILSSTDIIVNGQVSNQFQN